MNRCVKDLAVPGGVNKQLPALLVRGDEPLTLEQCLECRGVVRDHDMVSRDRAVLVRTGSTREVVQGSLKCGFSMMPSTLPSASRTDAVLMPSPTSCTLACSLAPPASNCAYASSAFATPQ